MSNLDWSWIPVVLNPINALRQSGPGGPPSLSVSVASGRATSRSLNGRLITAVFAVAGSDPHHAPFIIRPSRWNSRWCCALVPTWFVLWSLHQTRLHVPIVGIRHVKKRREALSKVAVSYCYLTCMVHACTVGVSLWAPLPTSCCRSVAYITRAH